MKRSRSALRGVMVALALLAGGVVLAETAQALTTLRYCGKTVAPRTKCDESPDRHTYDRNTVNAVQGRANAFESKCEKMTWWNNEGDVWSRRCRAGSLSVSGHYLDTSPMTEPTLPNDRHLLKVYVGNDHWDHMYIYGVGAY